MYKSKSIRIKSSQKGNSVEETEEDEKEIRAEDGVNMEYGYGW